MPEATKSNVLRLRPEPRRQNEVLSDAVKARLRETAAAWHRDAVASQDEALEREAKRLHLLCGGVIFNQRELVERAEQYLSDVLRGQPDKDELVRALTLGAVTYCAPWGSWAFLASADPWEFARTRIREMPEPTPHKLVLEMLHAAGHPAPWKVYKPSGPSRAER